MEQIHSRSRLRQRRVPAEERAELLGRYEQSGLPQRDFAEREGLPLSTLTYWLRRTRAKVDLPAAAPIRFGELTLPGTLLSGTPWVAEISLPDGRTVRLGPGVPEALLHQILRALC